MEVAVFFEALAPRVGDGAEALLNDQTFPGKREVDPPADAFLRQPVVIALGIVAEEREVEAVLAARGAVTAPGIAARFHEHGHDIEPEAQRPLDLRVFNHDGHGQFVSLEFDAQLRFAVGDRMEGLLVHLHQRPVVEGEGSLRGDIARDAIGIDRLDDERLRILFGLEVDRVRENLDAGEVRSGEKREHLFGGRSFGAAGMMAGQEPPASRSAQE